MTTLIAVPLTLVLAACGIRHLDPASPPDRQLPRVESDPPPPEIGTTPVAIDSDDTPSRVYDEFGRDICVTPCITNLTPGVHDLHFQPVDRFSDRIGAPAITVGLRPMVYRYRLGRHTRNDGLRAGGVSLIGLGIAGGVAAFPLATMDKTHEAGVDVAIGATASLLIGIVLTVLGRDETQMGSGTQWSPPGAAIYALPR